MSTLTTGDGAGGATAAIAALRRRIALHREELLRLERHLRARRHASKGVLGEHGLDGKHAVLGLEELERDESAPGAGRHRRGAIQTKEHQAWSRLGGGGGVG